MDTRIFAFQYDYTCTSRSSGPGIANIYKPRVFSLHLHGIKSQRVLFDSYGDVFRVTDSILPFFSKSRRPFSRPARKLIQSFTLLFLSLCVYLSLSHPFIGMSVLCVSWDWGKANAATDRSPYILYKLYTIKFRQATLLDRFRTHILWLTRKLWFNLP